MNNQIQETNNKTVVVGILKEKKIEFKVSAEGRSYATGRLVLICDTPIGKGEVEARVMQFADKKDGTPNGLFTTLQKVAQTYKAQNEFGEEADTIKIEGSLEDGTYYSVNKGDFVEKMDIKATFINRVDASMAHCCKTDFQGYLSKINPVEDELEVELVGIGYNGVAVPVKGMIPANLVPAFQAKYQLGCTTNLFIASLRTVKTEELQQEVGFGESFGEVITRTVNRNEVFGGGGVTYPGTPGAIAEDVVKQALALREAKLAKKKEDAEKRSQATGMSTNMETGFGGAGFAAPNGNGFNTQATGGFATNMPTGSFGGFAQ